MKYTGWVVYFKEFSQYRIRWWRGGRIYSVKWILRSYGTIYEDMEDEDLSEEIYLNFGSDTAIDLKAAPDQRI